uniref:Uncharacterized protein n=1 Tax=Arundo donax TaxID=35708 RepID=A0A0A9EBV8_ARUDO
MWCESAGHVTMLSEPCLSTEYSMLPVNKYLGNNFSY